MVSYEFYTGTYLGSLIPEKAFTSLAQRAGEALEGLQRRYRVNSWGEEIVAMAICAMAETIYAWGKRRGGISAATVGGVSVRYDQAVEVDKRLSRELYRKASIYLDIYRGVEV